LLVAAGGNSREVRSLLGRLAKEHGRPKLELAITETQKARPADPRSYMIGILRDQRSYVGRSTTPEPTPPACAECCDTSKVMVQRPGATLSFDMIEAPCPACSAVMEVPA
jgi:hypothetical protein